MEILCKDLRNKLQNLIEPGLYKSAETKKIQEEIKKKISENEAKFWPKIINEKEFVDYSFIENINSEISLGLTKEEILYLISVMYQESKDLNKLKLSSLRAKLLELECKYTPKHLPEEIKQISPIAIENAQKPIVVEEEILSSEEAVKVQRRYSDQFDQQKQDLVIPPESGQVAAQRGQEKTVNEEQMIEIAQRCFYAIAEQMAQKKMTVYSLYQDVVYKKKINGEDVELISPLDFLNGLRKLGIDDLQTLDYTCLVKVLAINDEEKHIRVNDLVQILEDYGITEMGSIEGQLVEDLKFEDLDKVSMVLMLALTEYLIKSKIPLYDLFGNSIYKQDVEIDGKQLQIDLINSNDFFEVMRSIGINTESKEHENLKKFLSLDASYPDKLLVKKLKKGIEEFAVNEELRIFAQKCYQELVDEDQLGEAPQSKPQSIQSPSGGEVKKENEGIPEIEFSQGNDKVEPGNTTL